MKDDKRSSQEEMQDTTIAQLLSHLKQLRQAVPVNYQLKAELKQRLLEQMEQMEQANRSKQDSPETQRSSLWKRWVPIGLAVLAVAGFSLFRQDSLGLRKPEPLSITLTGSIEQAAISPRGDQIGVVTKEEKLLIYQMENTKSDRIVSLPQTKGKYDSLAWSADGGQLAVIEQSDEAARIWVVDFDHARQYGSRLIWEEKGGHFANLSWRPQGEQIAFTRVKDGREEIWLANTSSYVAEKMMDGSQPDWSPDGKFIAFVTEGQIKVMNLDTKKRITVEKGTCPSWVTERQFTYISEKQQLIQVELDPQTKSIKSKQAVSDEMNDIKRAIWSRDGKHLLFVQSMNQQNAWFVAERDE